jgi:hypothetical protein
LRFLECQARRILHRWRELLGEDVGDARRLLRELLDGPLMDLTYANKRNTFPLWRRVITMD